MKLTDLTYMYAPAWPPAWAGPYASEVKPPEGEHGVLAGVFAELGVKADVAAEELLDAGPEAAHHAP